MALSAATTAAIREELAKVPRGERTETAQRLATTYGVSPATIYRVAKLNGAKRKREPARKDYRDWVRIAVCLAERAPDRVPLDLAIESGIGSGALPAAAADMPIATARRIARELGLTRTTPRTHRLSADYPMQALLIDGSSSEHLVVDHRLDNGDWMLRLHRRPYSASGYKNKPLGPDRMRVLAYGLWDMCTGYTRAVYVVARGESSLDAAAALCDMLAETGDPERPMHGVPDDLWSDLGPLVRGQATIDLLERLEVNIVHGAPYAKARMGGVERAWRTQWARFERSLFLGPERTITLSALSARLIEFERRENALRASRTPVAGRPTNRSAAWVALTNARPANNRLRKLPDNPLQTLTREAPRKIDANGIVRWESEIFEVADWADRWVLARRAIDGTGDLVLVDEATGEKRIAKQYRPRPYGQIVGVPKTPLRAVTEADAEAPVAGADPYAARLAQPRIAPMRARSGEAAPLENPLAGADRCRDIDQALELFAEYCPLVVGPSDHQRIVERIQQLELDRDAVIDLAQAITAATLGG